MGSRSNCQLWTLSGSKSSAKKMRRAGDADADEVGVRRWDGARTSLPVKSVIGRGGGAVESELRRSEDVEVVAQRSVV